MRIIKDSVEAAVISFKMMHAVRTWASTLPKVLLVMLLLEIGLCCITFVYIDNLRTEIKYYEKFRAQEIATLDKALDYKAALDSITLCIDSSKEEPKLHVWYCKYAVIEYKKASITWSQARVSEVVDKLAYGSMVNDISHYLRSIERDRLLQSLGTPEERRLKSLLSITNITLWILALIFVIVGVYIFLWILPNRQKKNIAVIHLYKSKKRH